MALIGFILFLTGILPIGVLMAVSGDSLIGVHLFRKL